MKKRNNPIQLQHQSRLAKLALANIILVRHSAFNDDELRVINWKTCNDIQTNGLQASSIMHEKLLWNALLCVFIEDENGQDWIYEQVEAECPCLQEELVEIFNERHNQLIAQVDSNSIIGMGWIYSPIPRDITDQKALAIFDQCINQPLIRA
ncbi:hypothetical protein VQ643_09645 [Pseudomonas sp. F1_0610]|uniref:hypothetical protein n=1 Tax=Pseudomonas sp. F1_0610 TaxID=3114284 RepID=UPI0039C2A733